MHAEGNARLNVRQSDGYTLRWHLNVIYEQTGTMPADLAVPPVPVELEHVWEYFQSMNAKRTYSVAGPGGVMPNPLSDEQIMAWERRHRIRLDPFESECIDALDVAFLNSHASKK